MNNAIPWRNLHSPIVVLDTSTDSDEAESLMHDYAQRIKRLRQTKRFGVFVRKSKGVYQVVLRDRYADKRQSNERDLQGPPLSA
ncbi:hypothetical protein AB0M00_31380 [Streptomyces chartreusis]|uniref:hypothetical protein n=1 Tax=Streptomyces chartreusis TaxID=1969 RepID=UPI003421AC3E